MARQFPNRRPGKPRRRPPQGGKSAPLRSFRPRGEVRSDDVRSKDADESAHPEGERLQKVLAAAGIASRRECEELITEGRVEVDGQVVTELGVRVDRRRQEIRVDGEPLPRPKLVYFAIHKPAGVVTTARDPAGRPRVIDLLPPDAGRVFTVGRLDLESEGLILATNDGELANRLTHPKHGVEKTYEVQVAGHLEQDVLAQLRRGVHLSEGYAHAVHARIKSKLKRSTLLEMVLDEGRNREVRRLLARVGHKVQRLTRVAVGPIRLGEMPRGAYRKLTPEELRKLRQAAEAGPRPDREPDRPPRAARPFAKKLGGKKSLGGGAGQRRVKAGAAPSPPRRIVGGDAADVGPAVIGDDASRALVGGRPPRGKPMFRKATGTKVNGRKPVKRRRPERPQRGSKKP
jgi:23S rRNA pseudouridine2605 synthase